MADVKPDSEVPNIQLPQVKKGPNFALIAGVLFLVTIVIGGGIFFFEKSVGPLVMDTLVLSLPMGLLSLR